MTLSQTVVHVRPRFAHGGSLLRGLLFAILVLLASGVLGGASAADLSPRMLAADELSTVFGGTCSSQCDSGDDEDEDDPEPSKTGSPYWVETRRILNSEDSSTASLEDMVINRSSSPLDTEFSYRHRTVRRIDFGGGWGRAFSLKVGGEIDVTRTRVLRKVLRPYEVGKVYTRLLTKRYTVHGAYYQDYTDGSRKALGTASGPYVTGTTIMGYVTYFLN